MEAGTPSDKAKEEPARPVEGGTKKHLRTLNAGLDSAPEDRGIKANPYAHGEMPGRGNPAPDTGLGEAQAQAGEGVPEPTPSPTAKRAADPQEPGMKERMQRLERRISG